MLDILRNMNKVELITLKEIGRLIRKGSQWYTCKGEATEATCSPADGAEFTFRTDSCASRQGVLH
jgi:hypothetical protein